MLFFEIRTNPYHKNYPAAGYLSYTDAEIKHRNKNDAILDFVDFWKKRRGTAPKMLIFDSKFTTYQNLSNLNESKENIKFLTLRRRGRQLLQNVSTIPNSDWQRIRIEGKKRKIQTVRVHDGFCELRNYKGKVRQLILTEHGREQPSFLITNDFDIDAKEQIFQHKYVLVQIMK